MNFTPARISRRHEFHAGMNVTRHERPPALLGFATARCFAGLAHWKRIQTCR